MWNLQRGVLHYFFDPALFTQVLKEKEPNLRYQSLGLHSQFELSFICLQDLAAVRVPDCFVAIKKFLKLKSLRTVKLRTLLAYLKLYCELF